MSASALLGLMLAASPGGDLAHDLRPGDRLVYRETLEQQSRGPERESVARFGWSSQVLVVTESADGLLVGFQRQRRQAELLKHRGKGVGLAEERVAFAERLARRPVAFAEANLVLRSGWGRLPWSAAREAGGELLALFRELPPLPLERDPDGRWRGDDEAGVVYRTTGTRHGEDGCTEVEGATPEGAVRVRFTMCEGVMRRLEVTGEYEAPPGQILVKERLVLELLERQRGEEPARWLADPERRHGVLAALLAQAALPRGFPADALPDLLALDEAPLQRRVLAVLHRLRLPPPPVARLEALLASADPRVRVLAVRIAEGLPPEARRPLLEPARADADAFVRRAAEAVLRPRPPAAEGCGPGWAEAALRAQRRPAHPVGETRRRMQAGEFAGRLYVLHVPEDYRGDEPFPLLIVLGGGPGRALPAAQNHRDAVDSTGYLAVYPHAHGAWWDEPTAAAVRGLLHEVLALLNVDVNRVYLTGPSNGGTGTFLYASRWPDRLAAAATLMGANKVFFEGMEAAPLLGNLTRLPLLFIHGDRDRVIPPSATRDSVKAIRRLDPQAPVEEVILPGRGHDLNLRTDEGRTLAFFSRHVRNPLPRRVVLETREAGARSYWIEVAAKDRGVASVEGEIRDDNTIALATRRVKQVRLRLRRELLPAAGPVTVLVDGREAWRGEIQDDCDLLRRSAGAERDPFLAHGWERVFGAAR